MKVKVKVMNDFLALKRLIDKLVDDDKLAKTVFIHNFSPLASLTDPVIVCGL